MIISAENNTGVSVWRSTDGFVTHSYRTQIAHMYSTDGGQPFVNETSSGRINVVYYATRRVDTEPLIASSSLDAAFMIPSTSEPVAQLGVGNPLPSIVNYGGYHFDGVTNYLDGNALTGISNGKKGTIFLSLRFQNNASATEILIATSGNYIRVDRSNSGNIIITAKNSSGTDIMSFSTIGSPCELVGKYNIMITFDLAAANSAFVIINRINQEINIVNFINDNIGYATPVEYSLGASNAGSSFFAGDMYILWFDPTDNFSVSLPNNMNKLTNQHNQLVFLGNNGELVRGYKPILFLGYSDYLDWHKNKGSAISTSFTEHGTPATVTTPIYGEYTGWRDKTITPTGTTGNRTINKPMGSVNFAVGTTSLTVTNSLVNTNTIIMCTIKTNDATFTLIKSVVASSGSFVINANTAATAETKVDFIIFN